MKNPIRTFRKYASLWIAVLPLLVSQHISAETATPSQRIGLPITLTDIYIPGGEAHPKPRPNREPPLVLRLLETKSAADGFRYDLEIYGLEEGSYNVADYLEALDPAAPPQFPEIPLTITSELPPGLPRPTEVTATPPGKIGGYRALTWFLGAFWILVLAALIFWKRRTVNSSATEIAPPTLAERLHSLLTKASQGALTTDDQAALERLILGHWKQRLPELDTMQAAQALAHLRHHKEAGPLLQQLERWLHAGGDQPSSDEIDQLLMPYRG
jgi:hypothetical protein